MLTSWGGNTIPLDDSIDADYDVQQEVLTSMAQVDAAANRVIGMAATEVQWQNRCIFGECAIGDWTAGVFKNITGSPIGLVNGGAI